MRRLTKVLALGLLLAAVGIGGGSGVPHPAERIRAGMTYRIGGRV